MGDLEGTFVALYPPADAPKPTAIIGVITMQGGTSWFVKGTGDPAVAKEQEAAFKKFCEDLRAG